MLRQSIWDHVRRKWDARGQSEFTWHAVIRCVIVLPQAWHQPPDLSAAFSRTAVDQILTLFGFVSLCRPLDAIGYIDRVDVLEFG